MKFLAADSNTPFLRIRETAIKTGLSEYFLRKGCRDGSISCVKSGSVYFINIPKLLRSLDVDEKGEMG